MNGLFKPEQVRGKIVLIGQVIVGGGYADTWETARGRKFGVVLLSEITQQILDGRGLIPAPKAWTCLLVLMLALSGAFLFYPRHALLGLGAHLCSAGVHLGVLLFRDGAARPRARAGAADGGGRRLAGRRHGPLAAPRRP